MAAIRATGQNRGRRVLLILAGLVLAAIVVAIARHDTAPPAAPNPASATTPLSTSAPSSPPATPHKTGTSASNKLIWADLTPAQQHALAPLAPEWDGMEPARKKKWLTIGNKFASMSNAEQQRVQKRMSEWIQLTPQQRRMARDSYSRAKTLDPNQRSARWEQYQQLSDEQKQKLANTTLKKRVATLPPARSKGKTVAPIKSTPRPILELALTPQPGGHPSLPSLIPSPPPAPISTPPSSTAAPTSAPMSTPAPPAATLAPAQAPTQTPAPAPAIVDPTQY